MTSNTANPFPFNPAEPSPTGEKVSWILVVDDEPSIRRLMEFVLKTQGYNVFTADGAAQAMQALQMAVHPPTLVICDVLMPDLDGLELVRRMCARIADLNVIFVSGHLTDVSWWPNDLKEHRFLAKPFENTHLLTAVKDAISGSHPVE